MKGGNDAGEMTNAVFAAKSYDEALAVICSYMLLCECELGDDLMPVVTVVTHSDYHTQTVKYKYTKSELMKILGFIEAEHDPGFSDLNVYWENHNDSEIGRGKSREAELIVS